MFGTRFGISYKLIGSPEGTSVTITQKVIFPKGGIISKSTGSPVDHVERQLELSIGEETLYGYALTDPVEMKAGTWRIQVWHQGKLLVERSFEIE